VGRHPKKRLKAVIATKFFGSLHPGDPNAGGASRKAILSSCDDSLRRLQTDYIDLYWMHCFDRHTPVDETMRALDDLVGAGKVRYIGFSDTPAWKVAQAQVLAEWRGWTRLCALQIEYSLLQRTVEGDLVPMALEMGLGVTPWSPLKSGVLSGKYTRENKGQVKADRGAMAESALTEKAYGVIDALASIARDLGTSSAAVALAWVVGRPGVASTIIGARTLKQLEDNLAALEVKLRPQDETALDKASEPALNFPADFLKRAAMFMHGGARVNGEWGEVWPAAPKSDAERY
jgi:aryl-alcohol dehydrogenase-like predicted oxidoreductase